MSCGSSNWSDRTFVQCSRPNIKPFIKQIKILSFKEFYDAFDRDDQNLLKLFDIYYQDNCCSTNLQKYYNVYEYDKTKFEYTLDINKCLKCYQKYCSDLRTELNKYDTEIIMDLINFNLTQNNINMQIYLINEEKDIKNGKNYSYYFAK